jgi:hypothetical protein
MKELRKTATMTIHRFLRITCAGSNFLGLTVQRLLASRVDGRTMPEAACPPSLVNQKSRELAKGSFG